MTDDLSHLAFFASLVIDRRRPQSPDSLFLGRAKMRRKKRNCVTEWMDEGRTTFSFGEGKK